VGTEILKLSPIRTGVQQGKILSPVLYIFSDDQLTPPNTFIAEYAGDKAIFTTHNNTVTSKKCHQWLASFIGQYLCEHTIILFSSYSFVIKQITDFLNEIKKKDYIKPDELRN